MRLFRLALSLLLALPLLAAEAPAPVPRRARRKVVSYQKGFENSSSTSESKQNKFEKVTTTVDYFGPAALRSPALIRLRSPVLRLHPPRLVPPHAPRAFAAAARGPFVDVTLPSAHLQPRDVVVEGDRVSVEVPRLDPVPAHVALAPVRLPPLRLNVLPTRLVQDPPLVTRADPVVEAARPEVLPGANVAVGPTLVLNPAPLVLRPPPRLPGPAPPLRLPAPRVEVFGPSVTVPRPRVEVLGAGSREIRAKDVDVEGTTFEFAPNEFELRQGNVEEEDAKVRIGSSK